jgi:hypothetical protein
MSVLAWIIKVYNKLVALYKIAEQIQKQQQLYQQDIDTRFDTVDKDLASIKKAIGIGVPVQETIVWGAPKP